MGILPLFCFGFLVFLVSLLLLHAEECALAHRRVSAENPATLPC